MRTSIVKVKVKKHKYEVVAFTFNKIYRNMCNICFFKMKELHRDVQNIDQGMCRSSQYEV